MVEFAEETSALFNDRVEDARYDCWCGVTIDRLACRECASEANSRGNAKTITIATPKPITAIAKGSYASVLNIANCLGNSPSVQ